LNLIFILNTLLAPQMDCLKEMISMKREKFRVNIRKAEVENQFKKNRQHALKMVLSEHNVIIKAKSFIIKPGNPSIQNHIILELNEKVSNIKKMMQKDADIQEFYNKVISLFASKIMIKTFDQ
jgi:hypothetical protein